MLAGVLLLVALEVCAQSTGGSFVLRRHVAAGGGGASTGGAYVLTGTSGQTEAASVATGAVYAFAPGFWLSAETSGMPPALIFANGFE
jgi:hypothetical protein